MTSPMKPQPMDVEAISGETPPGNWCGALVNQRRISYARGWNAAIEAMEEFEAQCLANEKD